MKEARADTGARFIRQVVKVKAHVDASTVQDPVLRRHAVGNEIADDLAKQGRLMHPLPTEAETRRMYWYVKKLEAVARTIAHTCALWPSAKDHNGQNSESLQRNDG